jgi:hypothetical protein
MMIMGVHVYGLLSILTGDINEECNETPILSGTTGPDTSE